MGLWIWTPDVPSNLSNHPVAKKSLCFPEITIRQYVKTLHPSAFIAALFLAELYT